MIAQPHTRGDVTTQVEDSTARVLLCKGSVIAEGFTAQRSTHRVPGHVPRREPAPAVQRFKTLSGFETDARVERSRREFEMTGYGAGCRAHGG